MPTWREGSACKIWELFGILSGDQLTFFVWVFWFCQIFLFLLSIYIFTMTLLLNLIFMKGPFLFFFFIVILYTRKVLTILFVLGLFISSWSVAGLSFYHLDYTWTSWWTAPASSQCRENWSFKNLFIFIQCFLVITDAGLTTVLLHGPSDIFVMYYINDISHDNTFA